MTVSLATEDSVVVQLMEAVDDGGAPDVLDPLECVNLEDEEVVVGAANEELEPLHDEAEHSVAVSLETAYQRQILLLEHVNVVLVSIHEHVVLLSHDCKGVLVAH